MTTRHEAGIRAMANEIDRLTADNARLSAELEKQKEQCGDCCGVADNEYTSLAKRHLETVKDNARLTGEVEKLKAVLEKIGALGVIGASDLALVALRKHRLKEQT